MSTHEITVSLVYATTKKQWLHEHVVARGTSVQELIALSQFDNTIEELRGLSISQLEVGIFAQKVALDTLLEAGDRVEIYRPLTADPKEVRRQLALLGKTMGKN